VFDFLDDRAAVYDVHRLRLLLELSRRGTLSAVAAALSYSPSTISQQLSQLEAEVGTPLLEPIGRRVRLTPQAEILVSHTETVLRQLEAAETAVARSLTELTGRVRLATFQTGLLGLLSPVLTALGHRHPALRVEVFQVEPQIALPRLLAHEYDMVLVEEFPHQPLPRPAEIDYRPLFLDPMRIAVSPGADPDDVWEFVAGRPWVAEPPDTAARTWVESLCREAGFEPDIRYTTADLLVHRQLITDGHAVGILPGLLGRSGPMLIDIPGGPHTRRILTAGRREAVGHPAIEACRQALVDASPAS
jgi:DNA-binding transcriptional LysR family regulator